MVYIEPGIRTLFNILPLPEQPLENPFFLIRFDNNVARNVYKIHDQQQMKDVLESDSVDLLDEGKSNYLILDHTYQIFSKDGLANGDIDQRSIRKAQMDLMQHGELQREKNNSWLMNFLKTKKCRGKNACNVVNTRRIKP